MAIGRQIGERRARKRSEIARSRVIAGASSEVVKRNVPNTRKMVI